MANDLLGVGVSGLKLSQSALRTIGHNIANSGTEGYVRQRVNPVTNPASLAPGGYIGNGVNVDSVERIVNNFVVDQMRTDTTLFNDLDSYHNQLRQLDNLLSDETTGLSSSLNSFFSALHNGADDPTSIPARQLVVSEAGNMADRFNTLYGRLQTMEESVDSALGVAVSEVNALAKNIAKLNEKIADAIGTGNGASPNDLLDQRDQAIKSLAAKVPVQVFDQGSGQLNVIIGSGQSLVIGPQANSLSLQPSEADASKLDIMFHNGGRSEAITGVVTGGELGGQLRFRDEMLESVYNELGRIAVVMADAFNKAHQKGIDLDGQFGESFFYDVNADELAQDRVIAHSDNASPNDRLMGLYIRDGQQIPASDYKVKIEQGGLYTITRGSDQQKVASGMLSGQYPFSVEFDGMELVFEQGSFQGGDQFTLQPVRNGARDFDAAIADAEGLAFGSPVLTDADLGNIGTGKISAGEVLSLQGVDGQRLPLFAQDGAMAPPLVVVFTSATTYDILDNSDPGNPVHLDPPIRDQVFVPGKANALFGTDPGATLVTTGGDMVGLPNGRSAVTQAALLTGGIPPDFTVSDFSGTDDQFSFDVVVSGTLGGSNATRQVTISGAALGDEQALLAHINAQLSGSDAVAYMADDGSLAFRLNTPGDGDITLQNYDADPDNSGVGAAAGLANSLLGFDIENSSYTTVGGADGVSGEGRARNGYPAEAITITTPDGAPGTAATTHNIFTSPNASALEIASQLSDIPGVQANAFGYAELSGMDISRNAPLQVSVNGEDLVEYTVDPDTGERVLATQVPDPQSDPQGFNDYLAQRINENDNLKSAGIHAVSASDDLTGEPELQLHGSRGDDLNIALTAAANETVQVGDGTNTPVVLSGNGNSVSTQVVVGGQLDVTLADGMTLETYPPQSMLFGDTSAPDFAKSAYLGIQASLSGKPEAGDTFTLDFNQDAAMDNRNALNLVNLESFKTLAGGAASLRQGYASLVEFVGIETSSARIDRDAAEHVMQQSEELHNSISGVNLDEEAADLIRFEQLFSANAQIISVARETFDRLINSF